MRVLARLSALTLSTLVAATAMAQTPSPAKAPAATAAVAAAPAAKARKPIVKTTCSDYVGLDESIKPKFIYYAVGHTQSGKKEAVFEEDAIEKIKPELDQYCSVHLDKSAYAKVLASSMASEGNAAHGHSKAK
ncbi:HdeA/HdeB family chaperone [Acidovorax sp. PRC11]|uniref:HdeA/HdeB family chaperone n=1 Tax=Acidovorax sp. PRC11 TaxID=2962592 RepID=UPI002881FFB8|nr:HdeA/HdeB family chaperone [Acidovorax sp. PRC11]MDT0136540.1 HdeA/HdeB family chaperone [Acidovorax sp. PRC11]